MKIHRLFDKLSRPGLFRLFLAWLVVLHHFCFLALGTWAVYVFFILSGYWISRLWYQKYRTARRPYVLFLLSRYWRLEPLYLVCTALCAGLLLLVSQHKVEIFSEITSPVWLARAGVLLSSASQPHFLVPAWSLDVEMQYYWLAPILCFLLLRGNAAFSPAILGVYGFLVAVSAATYWFADGAFVYRYLMFFLAGMMIYQMKWKSSRAAAVASSALVLGCLLIVYSVPAWHPIMGIDVMTSHNAKLSLLNSRFCVVLALLTLPWIAYSVASRDDEFDRHLGNLAYSVYLFHYIVFLAVEKIHSLKVLPHTSVYLGGLLAVALGSLGLYFCIEAPIERARRAAVQKRSRVLADPNASEPALQQ